MVRLSRALNPSRLCRFRSKYVKTSQISILFELNNIAWLDMSIGIDFDVQDGPCQMLKLRGGFEEIEKSNPKLAALIAW